ncbi:MAG TPA: hypothetical protein CFH80_00860 [Sulfurospirillum cavolei]|uniref:Uncharacterized protein n=1 Tax=Sulfurospirillum cavolei TaxID=366522 RepID=A0A2D3WKX7_9BACT|nr:MAG TPA: hypothetical protein CFH80_00860 [Sulfurospirillum cavolei]
MRRLLLLCVTTLAFLLSGCASKEVNPASFNTSVNLLQAGEISVYDTKKDAILFYTYAQENGKLIESSSGKLLPFRVLFMDLWVTGLGHDLRRLTDNHAETIKDALMYAAEQKGMQPLHINQKEFIIDTKFAHDMVDAINAYEEKMKRYDRDRRVPPLKDL